MRTIVHLSDLHMGRLDPAILEPLSAAIGSVRPDLVVLSGDLTQRAKPSEFREARRFLDGLHSPALVIPGNHDVPIWNVVARFLAPLDRYKQHIQPDLAPVYYDDEMIVFGVNTARSFTWAEGRISAAQVTEIVRRLAGVPRAMIRVIVTHHPFDLPPGVNERRLLGRAEMAMGRLATAGADLFLAGHLHISHLASSAKRYRIGGRSALIVQAGTVSMRGRGEQPSFNVLRVERSRLAIGRFIWVRARACFEETAAATYQHGDEGWSPSP